jgi:hypothetical protein
MALIPPSRLPHDSLITAITTVTTVTAESVTAVTAVTSPGIVSCSGSSTVRCPRIVSCPSIASYPSIVISPSTGMGGAMMGRTVRIGPIRSA